jgi:hypothetical protein
MAPGWPVAMDGGDGRMAAASAGGGLLAGA